MNEKEGEKIDREEIHQQQVNLLEKSDLVYIVKAMLVTEACDRKDYNYLNGQLKKITFDSLGEEAEEVLKNYSWFSMEK